MLSYEEAPRIFGGVRRVILDEIHALAESKRGDQLMLGLARLAALSPGLRRVGLSATVEDPPALAAFLGDGSRILLADPGPEPDITMLETGEPPPWSGGGGALRRPGGDGPDPRRQDHAGLHQHPRPGGAVLPGALGGQRRGAAHRPAPRLALARGPRPGRGGHGRRAACAPSSPPAASISASTGATSTW